MSFNGWVTVHRKILDHWVSQEPELFAFWMRLLIEANHSDKKRMFNGTLIEIKRGQTLFGLEAFEAKSGISRKKLRRYLSMLESESMIGRQKTNKYSLISIVNYEEYQLEGRQEAGKGQAEGKLRASKGQHLENVNTVENEKTKDKDPVPAKAGTSKYSDEFEAVWLARIKREGNDPKAGAYKCWKANLKRGVTAEAMTDGMARYKKFCEAKKTAGTEGVQMLQTFLGPNENYTQDWAVNQEVQANGKYNGFGGQGQQADYNGDGWADDFDPTADPFADLLNGTGPANN